ncbi:hypothetical protein ACI5KX_09510 [Erythrobacter sp. GH1-10]|uniref:hypothetical protein n=1 Tax=Erythrobacter sp. GH1-10 TaxID=3349334 RepID=UPI003877CEAC
MTPSTDPPARAEHDHTIYVLSGEPEALARFDAAVGARWEGGMLLDADTERGIYRYWAYEWRTAPQARQFMIPAMASGLDLEFEVYSENEAFPDLRARLDQAASGCDAKADVLFVLPTGEVTSTITPEDAQTEADSFSCLLDEMREGRSLEGITFGFLGNDMQEASDDK